MTVTLDQTLEDRISYIVRVYMTRVGGKQISLRRFARQMNKPLENAGIQGFTHQSVYNWLNQKHLPSMRGLTTLMSVAAPNSWQWQFANDLLLTLKEILEN